MQYLDPNDPKLVLGPDDEASPLYDERVKLPPDPALVANLAAYGAVVPIVARKRGGKLWVVDGRQRLSAAREVNKIFKAKGHEPIRVPIILRHWDDRDATAIGISLNSCRRQDSLLARAKNAGRLAKLGRTHKQIAVVFGVDASTIGTWLQLLELAPEVQAAVDDGRLRVRDALSVAKIIPEKQPAAAKTIETARPTQKALTRAGLPARRPKPTTQVAAALPPPTPPLPAQNGVATTATETGEKGWVDPDEEAFPRVREKAAALQRRRLLALSRWTAAHPDCLSKDAVLILLWIGGQASNGDLVTAFPRAAAFFDEA